ncbi:MAG: hypothetical protein WAO98_02440 [Alphaproteobacteria bacterium]
MTDEYGSREGHESETDLGAEAESWQSDQPPTDDFADQPLEETATVSEENEMLEEASGVAEAGAKKKSMMLPMIAALGGLLFLGAMVYWQFGSTDPNAGVPTPPPLSSQATPAPVPSPTQTADASDAVKPVEPLEAVAPKTNMDPASDLTVAATGQNPTSGVATPTPVSAPAPVPSVAVPDPVPVSAPLAVPAPLPAVVNTASPTSVDSRLSALAARVDDLQKSLDHATQQLNQVNNMLAANATPAAPPKPLKSVEAKTPAVLELPGIQEASETIETVAPAPVVKSKPRATVTKAKTKAVAKAKTEKNLVQASSQKKSATKWVLRAATPDEAWVASDNLTSKLHRVQVGDTLPGIGPITAIRQNGSDWMVIGSQGTVQ